MALTWSWLPVPGLIAGSFTLLLAAMVFRAEPRGRGRALGLFLFLWGAQTLLNVSGWFLVGEGAADQAIAATFWITLAAALAAYLWFVSTLDSPFTRRIRGRALVVYWSLVAVALVLMMVDQNNFVRRGPGTRVLSLAAGVVILYGLTVAAGAWRRARHPSLRKQAFSYLVAAAGHDLILIPMSIWFGLGSPGASPGVESRIVTIAPSLAALWLAIFLSYGLLRFHMFDIDLRIKWTIRRGTIPAMFLALFFVISESAAAFLGEQWGTYTGIAAAGMLLFAIAPLQRLADRLGDAAMPHVRDTEHYRSLRRQELYRAALEGAAADGQVTERERDILARLQDRLGLSASEALSLEREVLAAAAPTR